MPDKFDEMAREIEEDDGLAGAYVTRMCRAQPIGQPITEEQVSAWWAEGRRASRRARIAAALRSTDAKAREGCARIAEKAYRTFTFDSKDERYRILADQVEHIAAAIRSPEPEAGGEACGPIADEDGCCSSCGRGLVPCPACQGGGEACATEPLYTFTADGSEGSPAAPGFEDACKRGDVVPLKTDCPRCEDRGVVVDDPTYVSGLSPRNDLPQHDPYPCPACQGGDDAE